MAIEFQKIIGICLICLGSIITFGGTKYFKKISAFLFSATGSAIVLIGILYLRDSKTFTGTHLAIYLFLVIFGFIVELQFNPIETPKREILIINNRIDEIEEIITKIKKALIKLKKKIDKGVYSDNSEYKDTQESIVLLRERIASLESRLTSLEYKLSQKPELYPPLFVENKTDIAERNNITENVQTQEKISVGINYSKRCRNCGFNVPDSVEFCPRCGIKQE